MTEQKKNEQIPEGTDLERRAFVVKTAALAGAVGVAGAAGVAANVAAAAAETSAACGPNPRTMTVTFDFHSAGRSPTPDFRKLAQHVAQSTETVLSLTRRFTDDNGWGDWPRDSSRDASAMDLRRVSFQQIPFRTGA